MFGLILNVGNDLRQIGLAHAKCGVAILPGKTVQAGEGVFDPFGRAALEQLKGLADGLRWRQGECQVNVVRPSANLQRFHVILAGDAAEESPKAIFDVPRNPRLPVLGAKDDVIMKAGEGVGQGGRLADGNGIFKRRSATAAMFHTADRGLKATATIMCSLRAAQMKSHSDNRW